MQSSSKLPTPPGCWLTTDSSDSCGFPGFLVMKTRLTPHPTHREEETRRRRSAHPNTEALTSSPWQRDAFAPGTCCHSKKGNTVRAYHVQQQLMLLPHAWTGALPSWVLPLWGQFSAGICGEIKTELVSG